MKTTTALCFFSFISGLFFNPPKEDCNHELHFAKGGLKMLEIMKDEKNSHKRLERFNNAKDSIYETKRINK